MENKLKICTKCKESKLQSEFFKDKYCTSGFRPDCKTCNIKSSTEYSRKNNVQSKFIQLKSETGLSKEQYLELLELQDNRCAICNMTVEENKRHLSVDHCHNLKMVRGLLCTKCNFGIGYFNDNEELLLSAIKYLKENFLNKKIKYGRPKRLWHISDTHSYHDLLQIPSKIRIVIHSGDCSNPMDRMKNYQEVLNFISWFSKLPIKHKIYVAGNHDSSIEFNTLNIKEEFKKNGIIYLEHEEVIIEGIKIFGSPYTPTFGNWSFMKSREKLGRYWEQVPDDTDIMVCHGPVKGVLDLSYNRVNQLEFCGDNALKKRILQIKPKLFLHGHIHNCEDIINAGYTKLSNYETIFSNGSVVTDGKFGKLSSNGNIFIL